MPVAWLQLILAEALQDTFIGRQPILNRKEEIIAYELLFRGAGQTTAQFDDHIYASARVLVNSLNSLGVKQLLGARQGFINVNEDVLMHNLIDAIPSENFVLEILEHVELNAALLERIQTLKDKKFKFALDDFILDEINIRKYQPLLPFLSFIKVDLAANAKRDLEKKLKFVQGEKIKLLAEKVETRADFNFCKEMGFEFFQGFYFAKPEIVKGKNIDPQHRSVLELINLLRADADIGDVEKVFKQNADLSVNLLKFLNSAAAGLRNKVSSIRQALALVGNSNLLNWLMLMSFAREKGGARSNPLWRLAAFRATAMSDLFALVKAPSKEFTKDEAYFVGLLSMLDVLFQTPMKGILDELKIGDSIYDAVLYQQDFYGKLLKIVIYCEDPRDRDVTSALKAVGLTTKDLHNTALASFAQVQKMMSEM